MVDSFDDSRAEFQLDTSQAEQALERLGSAGVESISKLDERLAAIETRLGRIGQSSTGGFKTVEKAAKHMGDKVSEAVDKPRDSVTDLDKHIGKLTDDFIKASTAAYHLTKASLGVRTDALVSARKITSQYRQELTDAVKEANKLGISTANVAKAGAALNTAGRGLKSTFSAIVLGVNALGFTFFALEQTVKNFARVLGPVKRAIIDMNKEAEKTRFSMAAAFNNTYVEDFNTSLARSERFMKRISEEASKIGLPSDNLKQLASATAPALLQRGFSEDQVVKFTGRLAAAHTFLNATSTDGVEISTFRNEIRAFLSGQLRGQTSPVLAALGITKEDIENVHSAEEAMALLEEKTQGVEQAVKAYSQSFNGLTAQMKSQFKDFAEEVGRPIFKAISKEMREFAAIAGSEQFKEFKADLVSIATDLAGLVGIVADVTRAFIQLAGVLDNIFGPVQDGIDAVLERLEEANNRIKNSKLREFAVDPDKDVKFGDLVGPAGFDVGRAANIAALRLLETRRRNQEARDIATGRKAPPPERELPTPQRRNEAVPFGSAENAESELREQAKLQREIQERENKILQERLKRARLEKEFIAPSIKLALETEKTAIEKLIEAYTKALDKLRRSASSATEVMNVFARDGVGALKIELRSLQEEQEKINRFLTEGGGLLPNLKDQINQGKARLDTLARQALQSRLGASVASEQAALLSGVTGLASGIAHPLAGKGTIPSGGRFGDPRPGRTHAGLDLAAPTGTPVVAAASGKVTFVGWKGGYGNTIEVLGTDGKLYRFAHLSTLNTKAGNTVNAGQFIGRVGSTGNSSGPHLHFEVRDRNGAALNPTSFAGAPNRGVTGIEAPEVIAEQAARERTALLLEHRAGLAEVEADRVAVEVRRLISDLQNLEDQVEEAQLRKVEAARKIFVLVNEQAKATAEAEQRTAELNLQLKTLGEEQGLTVQEKRIAAFARESEQANIATISLDKEIELLSETLAKLDTVLGDLGLAKEADIFREEWSKALAEIKTERVIKELEAAEGAMQKFGEVISGELELINREMDNLEANRGVMNEEALDSDLQKLREIRQEILQILATAKPGELVTIQVGQGRSVTGRVSAETIDAAQGQVAGLRTGQLAADRRLLEDRQATLQHLQTLFGVRARNLSIGQQFAGQLGVNNQLAQLLGPLAGASPGDQVSLPGLSRPIEVSIDMIRDAQVAIAEIQEDMKSMSRYVIDQVIDPIQDGFLSMFDAILEGETDFGKIALDQFKNILRGLNRLITDQLFSLAKQNLAGRPGALQGSLGFLGIEGIGGASGSVVTGNQTNNLAAKTALAQAVTDGVNKSQVTDAAKSIAGAAGQTARLPQADAPGGAPSVNKQALMRNAGLAMLSALGFGQVTAASNLANETGQAQPLQGFLGGLVGGGAGGVLLADALGLGKKGQIGGGIIGALGGGLLGLTQAFPEGSLIRDVGGGAIGGALSFGQAGLMIGGPIGGAIGALVGGLFGGLQGLFGGRRRRRQLETQRNEARNTEFANNILASLDLNDMQGLLNAQASLANEWRRQEKAGKTGKQPLRDALARVSQAIADLRRRVEEITKELQAALEDFGRPVHQRGIVPELRQNLNQLKELLKMGVDKNLVFEFFNASVEDQVRELQDALNDVQEQITLGGENEKGELISIQQSLQEEIERIQESGRDQLESLRLGIADQASAIISEGRATAITPSAETRQQRLNSLLARSRREELELKEDIQNAILREQNRTARELADLQSEAVKIQSNILLLLQKAIELTPSELKGFSTSNFQNLLEFMQANLLFPNLNLSPSAIGGQPGITIENINILNDITDAELGRLIREEFERREQSRLNQRSSQL